MATHRPMRSCRLEDGIYLKVKHIADKQNRSFNNLLEVLLKEYVERYEKENGAIPISPDDLYQ